MRSSVASSAFLLSLCATLPVGCNTAASDDGPKDVDPGEVGEKQILFGDLHVHSTDSLDARFLAGPITGGSTDEAGPAQRCDFARFCSQLGFWSLNDHPENVEPARFAAAKAAIRACNAQTGGNGAHPTLVSFMGWEWTNDGDSPAADYGHKNVIFKDDAEAKLPARPIGAPQPVASRINGTTIGIVVSLGKSSDPSNTSYYDALGAGINVGLDTPLCEAGVDTRKLPKDCREIANDPAELYEKLDQWGFEALVIPHGTAWGTNHGPRASWRYQQNLRQYDERYEKLIEIYSGHGSSEHFRGYQHVIENSDGSVSCPDPTADFEPCCWRAGEIARAASTDCQTDPGGAACTKDVADAKQKYATAGLQGATTQRTAQPDEWGDCGQCRDCFEPAFAARPGFSVQAAYAQSNLDDPQRPVRFRFGIVGSTDSHRAGPGSGYKEGRQMADFIGAAAPAFDTVTNLTAQALAAEWERQNSYWYSGALVGVHSRGRSRTAIWKALQRRETFATSGERMLLWFDLVNGPNGERQPMGSDVTLTETPRFEVHAVGSFKQAPGCPDAVKAAAPDGFIEQACFGECYNPTDERQLIERIEVIKITPQIGAGEPLDALIQDPFAVLDCAPDAEGCTATFDDPGYVPGARPALYYVRALQQPTPQLNAENLRCERDASGVCVTPHPCEGGYHGTGDDCLAPIEERAWSSPIFVNP